MLKEDLIKIIKNCKDHDIADLRREKWKMFFRAILSRMQIKN